MGPQRQIECIIERPPFYHPPRSRPVTFESPIVTTRVGVNASKFIYRENNLSSPFQNRGLDRNYQSTMSNTLFRQQQQYASQSKCNNSDIYNSLPRPYQRNQLQNNHYNIHYYQQQAENLYGRGGNDGNQHQQDAKMPTILVNDRSMSPYPTSTVHKSMLNSYRSPVNYVVNSNDDSYGSAGSSSGSNMGSGKNLSGNDTINYSRLISPTMIRSTPSSSQFASQKANCEDRASSLHHGGASNYQQMAQALPLSIHYNPIEFIAAPYSQQQSPKSPGSGSSRSEEAREFLQRTLPSSSSLSSTVAAVRSGSGTNASADAGVGAVSVSGDSCLKIANQKVAQQNSNLVIPDTKRDEYMWNKQLEQVSIAHQTYRTLPIVQPKPKARHDLPSGNYMHLNQDPSWNITRSRSSSQASRNHDRKIERAIKNNEVSW